uniref:Uncharacterized protein n=2 Tax=Sus scrofa TaxID=9823 RepID=A0A4X1TJ99_PIG
MPSPGVQHEDGAGLVSTDNSTPQKEDLSRKTERKCFLKAKIYMS